MSQQPAINSVKFTPLLSVTVFQPTFDAPPGYNATESYSQVLKVNKDPQFTPNFVSYRKYRRPLPSLAYRHSKQLFQPLIGDYQQLGRTQFYNWDTWAYETKSWVINHTAGNISWHGETPTFSGSVASITAQAIAKATAKMLNGVKDAKFNGAVALAEASQVHRLIGDTAKKLAGAYLALKRGNLALAGETFGLTMGKRAITRYRQRHKGVKTRNDIDQMLSSGVLAIQYGIKPLINDIVGASELYAQKQAPTIINSFTASASQQDSFKWSSSDYPELGLHRSATLDVSVTVKYGCTYASASEVQHTFAQLGLSNPALLAWELLPWSFVIDWFLPLGNYLSSIDATLGLDYIDGYRSIKIHSVERWDLTMDLPLTEGDSIGYKARASRLDVNESFERALQSEFPSPQLPSFKNPVSIEHVINGVALLAGFKKNVYNKDSN